MRVLASYLDEPLRTFYTSLLASEARHHRTYLDLAETIFDPIAVEARLDQISAHEDEVIRTVPKEPRLHNG
jgi:tRNA-(ms[2]io[6]A)-hydroxylase